MKNLRLIHHKSQKVKLECQTKALLTSQRFVDSVQAPECVNYKALIFRKEVCTRKHL